jgi:hypothetical protein
MAAPSTTDTTTKPPEEVKEVLSLAGEPEDIPPDVDYYNSEANYLLKRQIIDSLDSNSVQRRNYARRTFWLTCSWIFLVILIVAASGLDIKGWRLLKLSDAVIITLITTTTLNVFGFFLLVMKYLFNTEELKELKDIFLNK